MKLQPFVKWVGGKKRSLPYLRSLIPPHFDRYIEPMAGGAALFWDLASDGLLRNKQVILGDCHGWLIKTYEMVRDAPDDLLEILRELEAEYHKAPSKFFYDVRREWNEGGRQDSARMIFLKQTSFNGLWRCNRQGKLNMPWGKYIAPRIHCPDLIQSCSRALQGVELANTCYSDYVDVVTRGDLVYFDPPYFQRFGAYTGIPFMREDHVKLIKHCAAIAARGGHVIYTHGEGPEVRGWLERYWPDGRIQEISTSRSISRTAVGRKRQTDLIVSTEMAHAAAA